jgi:hypothetical protein
MQILLRNFTILTFIRLKLHLPSQLAERMSPSTCGNGFLYLGGLHRSKSVTFNARGTQNFGKFS